MDTSTRKHSVRPIIQYWSMVKDLDDSQKLELVSMLIASIKPMFKGQAMHNKKKPDANDFAGIWSDNEFLDATEMVDAIREGRHAESNRGSLFI